VSDVPDSRPTVALVCYGSLLSPDELVPFLDTDGYRSRVSPVRVDGFRRVFNQRSVWRAKAGDGDEAGVLNAVLNPDRWMNAVLVPDLSRTEYDALRRRERGYRMVEVEPSQIEGYGDSEPPENDVVLLPTGNAGRVDGSVEPVPSYIDICLDGARRWGDGFYDDFLDTTDVGDLRLREYIKRRDA